MQDVFDIYDEEGEKKIGSAPRDEVHKKKLIHKSILIMLFNSRGELFVQRRSKNKGNSVCIL